MFDEEINHSKDGPLKQPLQEINSIKLPYNQNVFSIDFTLIDYRQPEDVRLLYYLENYDQDWIPVYSKRQASYFNIPPGNYVFHVKGTNSTGIWVEKKMELIILPPWYRSWWAFVIYGLLLIAGLIAFNNIQRKRIIRIERMKNQKRELAQAKEIEKAYTELKATQSQLIHSEKMASLGELTAGIAHEIQNPLNFVNNFSEVNRELVDELKEELAVGNNQAAIEISDDIKENEEKINHHGKRAEAIVKGMLQHSQTNSGEKELTDINALCDEYLRLSYHGLRAKDKSFNADFKLIADESLPKISVVPQDIGRVLLNLINNAFYACAERSRSTVDKRAKELTPQPPDGGLRNSQTEYKPVVIVSTASFVPPSGRMRGVKITVADNGPGIPQNIIDKIFQPFFTTKPTGSGTGLGLSLSYDIVKAHGGTITVESTENEGSEFIIQLPLNSTK
jgi:signal transduction histidine kinase